MKQETIAILVIGLLILNQINQTKDCLKSESLAVLASPAARQDCFSLACN